MFLFVSLFLVVGLTSCNNDLNVGTGAHFEFESFSDSLDNKGIDGCYSAHVTNALDGVDTIKAYIIKAPDGLSDEQPIKGQYVLIMKSDLQYPEILVRDTIDFKIESYEELPLPKYFVTMEKIYNGYFCRVKPCN